MKKNLPYIHPFLFALYPVLFLYSKNIHEYWELSLISPLIFSILFGTIVFFATKYLLKDVAKSAIISSFIIFTSLSFGRIEDLLGLKNIKLGEITIDSKLILTIILLIILFFLYKLVKKSQNLLNANNYLTILSCVLLLFAIIPIITFEAKTGKIVSTINQLNTQAKPATPEVKKSNSDLPDVYYFIFDRYAGPRATSEQYNFDNSQFLNFLKNKGFYVAEQSTTNYPKTFQSLTSSLNMQYIDFLTEQTNGGASPDESIATPYLRNSKVLNFLKDKGYTTINIGPKTWNPTSKNQFADKNYIMEKGTYPLVDAFGTGFLNTTIAEPIFKIIFRNPLDISKDPNNNEHRRVALFELNAISEAMSLPGPKFVFMHVLLPHDPFVFDAKCNPINEEEVKKHDHVYNYLNQLKCTNTQMEKIINKIFATSKTPPIVILQSDEGPFPMNVPIPPKQGWGSAKTESLKEKFPILNAYYFPNKNYEQLYQNITPVNSFKVIFNTNFGTNYPLIEDKNYVFKDEKNFYIFTDVTERIK